MSRSYYSHGKLLLTSEYAVLHGAKGLALPLKPGQSLTCTEKKEQGADIRPKSNFTTKNKKPA